MYLLAKVFLQHSLDGLHGELVLLATVWSAQVAHQHHRLRPIVQGILDRWYGSIYPA